MRGKVSTIAASRDEIGTPWEPRASGQGSPDAGVGTGDGWICARPCGTLHTARPRTIFLARLAIGPSWGTRRRYEGIGEGSVGDCLTEGGAGALEVARGTPNAVGGPAAFAALCGRQHSRSTWA